MSMEKHGVCENEGEEPKPEPKQAEDKKSCACPYHASGTDTLSKMADAAKDATPPK